MSNGKQTSARLDANGWEIPDQEPVAIPAGFKRPETLAEQVQRLVRSSISRHAEQAGFETFEDAEDFDVDDDFDPTSPYETFFDPVLNRDVSPDEFQRNAEVYRERYAKAHREYFSQIDRDQVLSENLLRRAVQRDQAARTTPSGGAGGQSPPAEGRPPEAGRKPGA